MNHNPACRHSLAHAHTNQPTHTHTPSWWTHSLTSSLVRSSMPDSGWSRVVWRKSPCSRRAWEQTSCRIPSSGRIQRPHASLHEGQVCWRDVQRGVVPSLFTQITCTSALHEHVYTLHTHEHVHSNLHTPSKRTIHRHYLIVHSVHVLECIHFMC